MAKNDIDVTFTSHLSEFNTQFKPAVKKTLEEWGIHGERNAKEIITKRGAVDTGLTRNSITWAVGGEKANIANYKGDKKSKYHPNAPIPEGDPYNGIAPEKNQPCVYIGSNVKYAPTIELGSSKKKREERPFLRPAVEDFADEYKEIAERNFGEIK